MHFFFKRKTRILSEIEIRRRATTKPRPGHGFPPAEPVPFTPGRRFFTRRVSVVLLFVCFRRSFLFLTYFFWLIVAFRFRMQLRPRPRRGSPLGGILRRGSVSETGATEAGGR